MVSKIAVAALVLIVACPILLGYGMNLSEVTETDYKVTGESVNVTPLLYSGSEYTTANADIYRLNTKFNWQAEDGPIYPNYNSLGSTKTSLPIYTGTSAANWGGEVQNLTNLTEYYCLLKYNYSASSFFTVNVYVGGSLVDYVDRIIYVHYDSASESIHFTAQTSSTGTRSGVIYGSFTSIEYVSTGGQTAVRYNAALYDSSPTYYANISAGYYFDQFYEYENLRIVMPERTQSVIVTINLDSITDSNYTLTINDDHHLKKTTTNGIVTWTAYQTGYYSEIIWSQDLYYNPSISNNTYQIKMDCPDEKIDSTDPNRPSPSWYQYHRFMEFRYIGAWPTLIGEANYYQIYDHEYWVYRQPGSSYEYLNNVFLDPGINKRTPTVRVDAAQFQAFQYNVIQDNTYQPSSFKENPTTTISDVQMAGTQLIFGGNTYTVNKGNITIGSHSIPVEGLTFSSVPNGLGTYDNRIGNTIISTSADPSTIQFKGKWLMSVSTQAMESYTYNRTNWTPGQFAWNGLDQNFLMVGMLSSLAAFIGLGIFARRHGGVIPLMIVCGGAAVLFFCMI